MPQLTYGVKDIPVERRKFNKKPRLPKKKKKRKPNNYAIHRKEFGN